MDKKLTIDIKYFSDDINHIEKIEKGDWIDLRCAEDIVMKPFEMKYIPLGVAMKLPDGFEANVVPRSSTYKKFGIIQANSKGIIDNSFSGNDDEWKFPALYIPDYKTMWEDINDANNTKNLPKIKIKKNDRICQFRIVEKMPEVEFNVVEKLGKNRGGFGTTGFK